MYKITKNDNDISQTLVLELTPSVELKVYDGSLN